MENDKEFLIGQIKELSKGMDLDINNLENASIAELNLQMTIIKQRIRLRFVSNDFSKMYTSVLNNCPDDKKECVLLRLNEINEKLLEDDLSKVTQTDIIVIGSIYALTGTLDILAKQSK